MKAFITPAYTFTPGASGVGTVDLSGISSFDIKRLIAIVNQTAGVIIYSTASELKKYTDVTGNVVTLFHNTTDMDAGDELQIIYETPNDYSTSAKQDTQTTELTAIKDKLPGTLGQKASAASLSTVLSSEQETILSSLATKLDSVVANLQATNGNDVTVIEGTIGTTPANNNPPAGAFAFILQGKPGNTAIRWSAGLSSTTDGHVLEDSRDTGVIPLAAPISICGEAASQGYILTWLKRV